MTIKQYNKGQGLLEMIIAIGVAMVGLIGVLSLAVSSLAGAKISEKRIVATNLAREGIEVIRNMRDSNWLAGEEWDKDISNGTGVVIFDLSNNKWQFNTSANNINDSGARLYRNAGAYSHLPNGQSTAFYRLITIESLDIDSLKIVSEVRWLEGERIHNLIAEDRLYDWK